MFLALFRHGSHAHPFGPVLLLIVIALIAFAVVRSRRRKSPVHSTASDPAIERADVVSSATSERQLSERFARGEIGLSDYREQLVKLRDGSANAETNGDHQAPTA